MKYKLVAADFDSTLYGGRIPTLPEENIQAIKDYIACGGLFFILTGRMYQSILPYAQQLGLEGELIVYQGARIYDIKSGECVQNIELSTNDAIKILEYAESKNVHSQFYYNDDYYAVGTNKTVDRYCTYCNIRSKNTGIRLSEYVSINRITPNKIMLIMTEEAVANAYEDIISEFHEKYNISVSNNIFIEIVDKKVSKGNSIEFLAKKYKIDISETVAIGDSGNDISMIIRAGLGIAVGNAMDSLKEKADIVMEENAEDNAVAVILRKIIANEL